VLTENKLKTPKEEEKRRAEQIEEGQRRVSEIREKLAKKEDELKECRSQVDEMKNNFDREKKKINQEINHKEQTLLSALETMKEWNEKQETQLEEEEDDQKIVMQKTADDLKTE
jgi:chromosome segregation ATPase